MTDPTRLVVLLTGDAPDPIKARHGDFMAWFRRHLGAAGGGVVVDALDLTAADEDHPLPDLSGYAGVVMSGSAAMVAEDTGWMRRSVRTVRDLLEREQPFLGVCFGHQILGLAVGAEAAQEVVVGDDVQVGPQGMAGDDAVGGVDVGHPLRREVALLPDGRQDRLATRLGEQAEDRHGGPGRGTGGQRPHRRLGAGVGLLLAPLVEGAESEHRLEAPPAHLDPSRFQRP